MLYTFFSLLFFLSVSFLHFSIGAGLVHKYQEWRKGVIRSNGKKNYREEKERTSKITGKAEKPSSFSFLPFSSFSGIRGTVPN